MMKKTILCLIAVGMCFFIILQPASAQLQGAGPVDPANGFPLFYMDTLGLSLVPCLDVGNCPPAEGPNWNPALPVVFPSNFPSDFFYWIADPVFNDPGGNVQVMEFDLRGGFFNENELPVDGAQLVFQRKRFRLGGLPSGTTIKIDHPFGTDTITDGDPTQDLDRSTNGSIVFSIDSPSDFTPLDFDGAVTGNLIGPFLVGEIPPPPPGFIGTCSNSQTVTGGPYRNTVSISGGGLNLITDQWIICGKRFDGASTCIQPPPDMTNWWPGDGNTNDIIGGRKAVLLGDAVLGPGLVGDAFVLDGDGDFAEVANVPALNVGTGDFTVDLWVNFNTTEGEQVLVEKWVQRFPESGEFPGSEGWTLTKLDNNALLLAMADKFGTEIAVASDELFIPTDTWIHVAATRRDSQVILFIDGVPVAQGESSLNLNSTSSLKFGHRGSPDDTPGSMDDSGFFLNGRIDEVELFVGRALYDTEIQAIVGAGGAGKCKNGDFDGDGVPNDEDECPNSDLSLTVVIDGCDSGATNDLFIDDEVFGEGCTIADLVTQCIEGSGSHIDDLRCATRVTGNLIRDGSLTLHEGLGILRCTLRAVFH